MNNLINKKKKDNIEEHNFSRPSFFWDLLMQLFGSLLWPAIKTKFANFPFDAEGTLLVLPKLTGV